MDFWFPSSDCHPQVLKIHCENATETKKFTENKKTEVNIDYLILYLYAIQNNTTQYNPTSKRN